MFKIEIKTIKGYKYVYLKDKVKVNGKYFTVSVYVGRLEKISARKLTSKFIELEKIKLKKYVDYRLKKYRHQHLDEKEATRIEILRYYYDQFKEYYPDEVKRYEQAVFVRYVQGTTAIEGNTITPQQAEVLLEHGVVPAGKSVREVYEIKNFENLRRFLEKYEGDISEKLIKKMHEIIMQNLLESPGEYRRISVSIEKADHEPPPAFEVPDLMKELVKWYKQNRKKMHPFELAVLLHTKFVTIHPFVDGNGRVARALTNFVLERNGYPTLYLGLEHREQYLDAVAEGNEGNYKPIVKFMYDVYLEQHERIMENVRNEIMKEAWGFFVKYTSIPDGIIKALKMEKLCRNNCGEVPHQTQEYP